MNVRSCSRCGKDHEGLVVKAFTNAPDPDWTHFAECPETKEPILVKYIPDDPAPTKPSLHDFVTGVASLN